MNRIEIMKIIQKQWPYARLTWPFGPGNLIFLDEKYHVPDPADVDGLIHWRKWYQLWTKPGYRPETFDCDDFAMECYRNIRRAYSGDDVLAFGFCLIPNHALNFMITTGGIWLYDYRLDKMWQATGNDVPYFWMV